MIAVMRSGWGKDDTYVWMSCGDYLGAHQHDEAGSFQIFRHSLLSGADGYYDDFDTDHWAEGEFFRAQITKVTFL